MTDTLRITPRYIRNTDAFGWQGADKPDGPWRSITPPQTGTPWQTAAPVDELCQASAEAFGIAELSPQAQAVLDAVTKALYSLPAKDIPNEAARIAEIASVVLHEVANQVRKEQFTYAESALFNISEISNSIKNYANQKL